MDDVREGEMRRAVSLPSQGEQGCGAHVPVAFIRSVARREAREPEPGCRQVESC